MRENLPRVCKQSLRQQQLLVGVAERVVGAPVNTTIEGDCTSGFAQTATIESKDTTIGTNPFVVTRGEHILQNLFGCAIGGDAI